MTSETNGNPKHCPCFTGFGWKYVTPRNQVRAAAVSYESPVVGERPVPGTTVRSV